MGNIIFKLTILEQIKRRKSLLEKKLAEKNFSYVKTQMYVRLNLKGVDGRN
jgi:hypothetical protein